MSGSSGKLGNWIWSSFPFWTKTTDGFHETPCRRTLLHVTKTRLSILFKDFIIGVISGMLFGTFIYYRGQYKKVLRSETSIITIWTATTRNYKGALLVWTAYHPLKLQITVITYYFTKYSVFEWSFIIGQRFWKPTKTHLNWWA